MARPLDLVKLPEYGTPTNPLASPPLGRPGGRNPNPPSPPPPLSSSLPLAAPQGCCRRSPAAAGDGGGGDLRVEPFVRPHGGRRPLLGLGSAGRCSVVSDPPSSPARSRRCWLVRCLWSGRRWPWRGPGSPGRRLRVVRRRRPCGRRRSRLLVVGVWVVRAAGRRRVWAGCERLRRLALDLVCQLAVHGTLLPTGLLLSASVGVEAGW
jgi:hypothetical protein